MLTVGAVVKPNLHHPPHRFSFVIKSFRGLGSSLGVREQLGLREQLGVREQLGG